MSIQSIHSVRPEQLGFTITTAKQTACLPGEFKIAAVSAEHGHLFGMVNSLKEAGAQIKWVYDKSPDNISKLKQKYPEASVARSIDEILDDQEIRLVAAADVPCRRAQLGIRVMQSGKDYFTDKTPFTTFEQIKEVRETVKSTSRKYMVYFAERIGVECAMLACEMIKQGAVGRVLNIIGLGPHHLGPLSSRPDWFFRKEDSGGILCDIGSHQCEQFLEFTGSEIASVNFARVCNFAHPEVPELEDFGEASLIGDNGASFYFRVDWFSPDGLRSWGDGRTMIMGTDGTIELRKNIDIGTDLGSNRMYYFNGCREVNVCVENTVGKPFFANLIRDCLDRTETAMTQERVFNAGKLALECQKKADLQRMCNDLPPHLR